MLSSNTNTAKRWEKERLKAQQLSLAVKLSTDDDGCTCRTSHSDGFCKACATTVLQPAMNHIHRKVDGNLLIRGDGSARFLGFWESFFYNVFKVIPNV